VLLSPSYVPRALSSCAHALLPLACRAASEGGEARWPEAPDDDEGGGAPVDEGGSGDGGGGGGGGEAAAGALAAFRRMARQLVTQSAPRPGGARELRVAGGAIAVRTPRPLAGGGGGRWRVPEVAESCAEALAPLSASGISALLTALLLEQKARRARPRRRTGNVWARSGGQRQRTPAHGGRIRISRSRPHGRFYSSRRGPLG
jgi:hypothetical protein